MTSGSGTESSPVRPERIFLIDPSTSLERLVKQLECAVRRDDVGPILRTHPVDDAKKKLDALIRGQHPRLRHAVILLDRETALLESLRRFGHEVILPPSVP